MAAMRSLLFIVDTHRDRIWYLRRQSLVCAGGSSSSQTHPSSMAWIDLVAEWWDMLLLRTSDMGWPILQDTAGAGADALRRTAVQAAGDGWPGLDAFVPCTDWVVVLHADR